MIETGHRNNRQHNETTKHENLKKEGDRMPEKYTVSVKDGFVHTCKQDGTPEKTICSGATSAEIKGEEVVVTMKDGKVKVYSVRGFYKGTR